MCAAARVAVRGQLGELFFPLWVSGIELRSSAFTSLYWVISQACFWGRASPWLGLTNQLCWLNYQHQIFSYLCIPRAGISNATSQGLMLFNFFKFFNETKLCILFCHSGPRVWGTNTLLTEQLPPPIKRKRASNQENRETKNHFPNVVGLHGKAKEGCSCWQAWCGLITTEGNPFEACRQTSSIQFTVRCRELRIWPPSYGFDEKPTAFRFVSLWV